MSKICQIFFKTHVFFEHLLLLNKNEFDHVYAQIIKSFCHYLSNYLSNVVE